MYTRLLISMTCLPAYVIGIGSLACAPGEPIADFSARELMPSKSQIIAPVEPDDNAPVVVAEVETSDGATLIFLDEAAPGQEPVISVEIRSAPYTPETDALLARQPSALELFRAVAPEVPAPAELVREHEYLAAVSPEVSAVPRTLAVPQTAPKAQGETSGYFDCNDIRAWSSSFDAWAPDLSGDQMLFYESGTTVGYVGYAYKFYFDVCRPIDTRPTTPYYTAVQRRSSSAYDWYRINSETGALNFQQRRWRFYRNTWSCSSFQYRLVVIGTGNYHRAARYSDEWSCEIGT